MEEFLVNAPVWLLSSFYLRQFEEGRTIVRENETVDRVYILLEGYVKGIDYQDRGESYEYMWFHPVNVFGSMEILLNIEVYRTTLKTVTRCTLLEIPEMCLKNGCIRTFMRFLWKSAPLETAC